MLYNSKPRQIQIKMIFEFANYFLRVFLEFFLRDFL